MEILVTGGMGYIGSHTVVELINCGYEPVIVDNLINSSRDVLGRIERITGVTVPFHELDVCDQAALDGVFKQHEFGAVIHFAGLKAVGESVAKPLEYYRNNIDSTLSLLSVMKNQEVKKLVFSSSATVYGDPISLPLTEDMPRRSTNPYGWSKVMIEQILEDLVTAGGDWSITSLRYFNPVGAHPSGLIGEEPVGIPNNLLPYISKVAHGELDYVRVFGNDYETPDGTGVRDYIHVVDLASAHVAALQNLEHPNVYKAYNIGTGQGTSVLELIRSFSEGSGVEIPYRIVERRPGDVAECYADVALAADELGWQAKLSIDDACRDSWNWQRMSAL
jgi:UDP-glucose 4-epimerase